MTLEYPCASEKLLIMFGSDANTCNRLIPSSAAAQGPRALSYYRNHLPCMQNPTSCCLVLCLPSFIGASEEPFVCIMQIQTLIHATNTTSSQAWVQDDLRTTDFAPNMLFMQHDNVGICPLLYMPQKNLLSASCKFRR